VAQRFRDALAATWGAAALIVIGIVCLVLAPHGSSDSATGPTLVTLTLNEVGKERLCDASSSVRALPALKMGGTDAAPLVLTMPTKACPTQQYLKFKVSTADGKGGLGVVSATP
jgi:hypothetical protein